MDPFSVFNEDAKRNTISILIPGFIGLLPFTILLYTKYFSCYSTSNNLIWFFFISIPFISLYLGFIFENLGSLFETNILDDQNRFTEYCKSIQDETDAYYSKKKIKLVWQEYLKLDFKNRNPIILRYYSSIYTRFKTELNSISALLFSIIGWSIVPFISDLFCLSVTAIIICTIILLFQYNMTFKSYYLLHKLKVQMILLPKKVEEIPNLE